MRARRALLASALALALAGCTGSQEEPPDVAVVTEDPTDETGVAGVVIERTEAEPTPDDTAPAPRARPRDDETEEVAADGDGDAAAGPRAQPAPGPDTEPEPEPEPGARPRPRPRPRDEPRPTPSPTPSPTPDQGVALREGRGGDGDRAIAQDGDWTFLGGSEPGAGGPADPRRRLTVRFDDSAYAASGPVVPLQCDARLTAGDRRLRTDSDHVFEISLAELDSEGNPARRVTAVLARETFDLAPGESSVEMSTDPVEVNAEDGVSYTCTVRYRAR